MEQRDALMRDLESANKLIFVKQYQEAANFIDKQVKMYSGIDCILLHLRKIELACKLNTVDLERDQYISDMNSNKITKEIGTLCIALIDQYSNRTTATQSLSVFNKIIQCFF